MSRRPRRSSVLGARRCSPWSRCSSRPPRGVGAPARQLHRQPLHRAPRLARRRAASTTSSTSPRSRPPSSGDAHRRPARPRAADECATARPELALSVAATAVPLTLDGRVGGEHDAGRGRSADHPDHLPLRGAGRPGRPATAPSSTFQDSSAPGVVGWREVTAVGDRMTLTQLRRPERRAPATGSRRTRRTCSPRRCRRHLRARSSSSPGGPPASLAAAADDGHRHRPAAPSPRGSPTSWASSGLVAAAARAGAGRSCSAPRTPSRPATARR